MRSTEFVKITVVYGHIDENGLFVRKWPARKMAITDKSPGNASLSVKYVLLTDKSAEKGTLSVKFERNLGVPPRIIKNTRHDWREFSSLFSCVRGHERSLPHIHNRASARIPLVPSYPSQARLGYTGADRSAPHLHNRVPARIPPIASKASLDETSSPSVAQSLRTGS